MQAKVIEQEKALLLCQFAGTAAHQLGQPLSAILLNCFLLESLSPAEEKVQKAAAAIKRDAAVMCEIIEKLKLAEPEKRVAYYSEMAILDIEKK